MIVKSVTTLIITSLLWLPHVGHSAEITGTDVKTYVKDAAITAKIKTKLTAKKLANTFDIHVDTDNSGNVSLSGTAKSQSEIDHAMAVARDTDGVSSVNSEIKIEAEHE